MTKRDIVSDVASELMDAGNALIDAANELNAAADFPSVWVEAVQHVKPRGTAYSFIGPDGVEYDADRNPIAPVKPRGTIRLERSVKNRCWQARFHCVEGMPEGIVVPLPWTLQAGVWVVVSDMEDRFPGAQIFAS